MDIQFNETQGWWVRLDPKDVARACVEWLERQGCTVEPRPAAKDFSVALHGEKERRTTHRLTEVSFLIPEIEGSITFAKGAGPSGGA